MIYKTTTQSIEETYGMYIGALGETPGVHFARTITDPTSDNPAWEDALTLDAPGHHMHGHEVTVDHLTWLNAMNKIVNQRATINIRQAVIDAIAAVLDAKSGDETDNAVCQLDIQHLRCILTVAAFGSMVHFE